MATEDRKMSDDTNAGNGELVAGHLFDA